MYRKKSWYTREQNLEVGVLHTGVYSGSLEALVLKWKHVKVTAQESFVNFNKYATVSPKSS